MLRAALEQGSTCPCCDQKVKAYRRSLYPTPMKALKRIAEHLEATGEGSVHLGKFLASFKDASSRGGDTARLVFWGLIEKRKAGHYAITDLGKRFVNGECRIPKYKWFYNEQLIELGDTSPLVSIKEILDVDRNV